MLIDYDILENLSAWGLQPGNAEGTELTTHGRQRLQRMEAYFIVLLQKNWRRGRDSISLLSCNCQSRLHLLDNRFSLSGLQATSVYGYSFYVFRRHLHS
jgi:hypothetical protein